MHMQRTLIKARLFALLQLPAPDNIFLSSDQTPSNANTTMTLHSRLPIDRAPHSKHPSWKSNATPLFTFHCQQTPTTTATASAWIAEV
jgi:hypothetical protein